MVERLKIEVNPLPRLAHTPDKGPEDMQTDGPAEAPAGGAVTMQPPQQGSGAATLTDTPASAAKPSGKQIPYWRRVLLKGLLRAIALASYAPGFTASRPLVRPHRDLHKSLQAVVQLPSTAICTSRYRLLSIAYQKVETSLGPHCLT